MAAPTHPIFAILRTKLARLNDEIVSLDEFVRLNNSTPDRYRSTWSIAITLGGAVRNAYNGMEDCLKTVAREIDGHLPSGESWHQDLLDQMAAPSNGRPAVLNRDLYEMLIALKSFRHVVNHTYGTALKLDRARENVETLQRAAPAFVQSIAALEISLQADCGDDAGLDGAPSVPSGPR